MFIMKKVVGTMLMPLPLCLLISFVGVFLLWRGRHLLVGKILISFGLIGLTLLSYNPVSRALNAPLNCRYEAYGNHDGQNKKPVSYVVVLAGGHKSDPAIPVTSQMNGHALIRLVEGVRVWRQNPGAALILSGCGSGDPVPESQVMAQVAAFLGVPREKIILESDSYDTKDQARFVQSTVRDAPFALVTSANHMPRSMGLFEKLGMHPIPAPAGTTSRIRQPWTILSLFPSAGTLEQSTDAIHEYLGLAWGKLRGQI